MPKPTIATVATDIKHIMGDVREIKIEMKRMNGCIKENHEQQALCNQKLNGHLDNHKMEKDSKFKWIAAITGIAAVIIAVISFIN